MKRSKKDDCCVWCGSWDPQPVCPAMSDDRPCRMSGEAQEKPARKRTRKPARKPAAKPAPAAKPEPEVHSLIAELRSVNTQAAVKRKLRDAVTAANREAAAAQHVRSADRAAAVMAAALSPAARREVCTCGHSREQHAGGYAACRECYTARSACSCARFTWKGTACRRCAEVRVMFDAKYDLCRACVEAVQRGEDPHTLEQWTHAARTERRGGARKGAGRKPGKPEARRTCQLSIRLTPTELHALTAVCEAEGEADLSAWIRERILDAVAPHALGLGMPLTESEED